MTKFLILIPSSGWETCCCPVSHPSCVSCDVFSHLSGLTLRRRWPRLSVRWPSFRDARGTIALLPRRESSEKSWRAATKHFRRRLSGLGVPRRCAVSMQEAIGATVSFWKLLPPSSFPLPLSLSTDTLQQESPPPTYPPPLSPRPYPLPPLPVLSSPPTLKKREKERTSDAWVRLLLLW